MLDFRVFTSSGKSKSSDDVTHGCIFLRYVFHTDDSVGITFSFTSWHLARSTPTLVPIYSTEDPDVLPGRCNTRSKTTRSADVICSKRS